MLTGLIPVQLFHVGQERQIAATNAQCGFIDGAEIGRRHITADAAEWRRAAYPRHRCLQTRIMRRGRHRHDATPGAPHHPDLAGKGLGAQPVDRAADRVDGDADQILGQSGHPVIGNSHCDETVGRQPGGIQIRAIDAAFGAAQGDHDRMSAAIVQSSCRVIEISQHAVQLQWRGNDVCRVDPP